MAHSKAFRINYDKDDVLGEGGFAYVFRGTFLKEGEKTPIPVAVKRVEIAPGRSSSIDDDRGEEALRKLDHVNIVRLYHVENHGDFRCYALKLCDASLDKVFLPDGHPKKYKGPLPIHERVLLHLAQGLQYIHSQKLIHRDIKPHNVLIASSKLPVTMKWADFGLSKSVDSNGEHSHSGIRGTRDWMAPEVLDLLGSERDLAQIRGTIASDVFVAGCLFFFYFTDGLHPFGSGIARLNNIRQGNHVNLNKLSESHFAYRVIRSMMSKAPGDRPTMGDVLRKLPRSNEILRPEFLVQFKSVAASRTQENIDELLRIIISSQDFCRSWETSSGWTPLHVFCRFYAYGNLVDIVRLLVYKGADVNCKTTGGWTTLHILCRYYIHSNLIHIVRLLVDKGVDVNCKLPDGWTALHFLCLNYTDDNLIDVVRLLVDKGAEVSAKTDAGRNAIDLLGRNEKKNAEVAEWLRESGVIRIDLSVPF